MPSYSSLFWFYISAIYIPVIISWYLGVSPQRLLIYFRYLLPATQCRFILRYPLLHLLKRHSFLFLFSIEILNAFLREAFSDDSILLGTPLCVLCESNELTWSLLTVGGYNYINMRWLQKKFSCLLILSLQLCTHLTLTIFFIGLKTVTLKVHFPCGRLVHFVMASDQRSIIIRAKIEMINKSRTWASY